MLLVDTSVWIEILRRNSRLRPAVDEISQFVSCPPIVQEVLQGLAPSREAKEFRSLFLALPLAGNPVTLAFFLNASDIFALGRRKGLTIRSSVDCLIAAIAIENDLEVWHQDRDFATIARFTSLKQRVLA